MKENENRDRNITHVESRNLVGLIRGNAVCMGNAEIIRNLAAEFGIESICVRGMHDGGHSWNQVKLDGIWYDDDFTQYQGAFAAGNIDRCGAFLMGMENGVSVSKYNDYRAFTKINDVGKNFY